MNLPTKIISTAVIALTIGLSVACSSSDATPVSNEPADPPAVTAAATLPPTDEPKRQMPVVATPANLSGASSSDGNLSDDQRWCLAWALDNLQPHIYAEFRQLDPTNMDDLDRTVWRPRLQGPSHLPTHNYGTSKPANWESVAGTCWMYWSEPLTTANAGKRNYHYEAECLRQVAGRADSRWDALASYAVRNEHHAAYEIPNQYVRVLRWLHMPGRELLNMDEPPYELLRRIIDKEYAYNQNIPSKEQVSRLAEQQGKEFNTDCWHLVGATLGHRNSPITACLAYYPQLYYGYWVPFTERSDEPPAQLSDQEIAEVERLREGPLYLPRP